ncbi:unnamed protein product [Durusdinium trenchii]|uniref:Tyrosine-protein kinase ephrin type A/B receptor-like domain-containing protein n=1 Tax=Durusdinium trenchii TaxID=1381693 RepID=A0ABP0MFB3_9DINO
MRSLVATLLALGCLQPLQVAATCLANGTEPAALKNLVNPSGEAYPVGLFVGNWPGGLATSSLAGILIQEMLGYNVSYNGPGGSTTHGMYAISGCRNPTATTAEERGCDAKVTYNHITMEMWEAYPSLWADLQKNKAMAPKALTSMGYDGKTSTYLLKSVQESVAESEGLPLEFYTSYNANWWKPWLYFDNTSSVNATRFLKKCSETQIFSDSLMRNYLAQTGDSAGVQIIDGAVVGSCPDEYFWRAPSCRNETFKCVIFFTGGAGWSVHLIMQQATAWNMPIAMAIANTWGDFAAMPVAHRSLFYWWEPDPTFLELAPVEVIFPPHDRVGHANGDLKTAPSTIRLTKGVSKDLLSLAPRVENFLVNMEISMAMINAIMLDQKNTGDSWDDVTCRWLQGNKATWESWLPDDTTCFAGFGLVDIESGELAMDRTVREGKRCQACPSGTFSERLVDSIGVTYICSACPLGTSQASGASLKCEPCDKGTYQDELGSQSCKRCPLGTYQDQEGQAQCIACPDGSSTLGLGSVAFTDCGCVEGRIDVAPAGLTCEVCSVGLTCPAMGTLESYETGVHPLGTKYLPIVDAGYYTTAAEPLKVYKCGKTWHCPGGVPDSCAGGRAGVPCAECPQGKTWSEGQCMECEAWRQILWGISVVGVFLFLTASYYLMTSKVTAKASVLFTTTCAFGMLVSLLQSVGIIGMMTVEWPVDLKGFFSYFQVLLLDLDSFGFACFAGAETSFRYIVSVVFFPAAVSWLVMNFILSKVLPQHRRWGITKVASCSGQVLQVGQGSCIRYLLLFDVCGVVLAFWEVTHLLVLLCFLGHFQFI